MTQAWINVKDLSKRFGGLIGRDKIIKLLKENHIKSYWVGRALATTEVDLEDFESRIMEAERPIVFKSKTGEVILEIVPQTFIKGQK